VLLSRGALQRSHHYRPQVRVWVGTGGPQTGPCGGPLRCWFPHVHGIYFTQLVPLTSPHSGPETLAVTTLSACRHCGTRRTTNSLSSTSHLSSSISCLLQLTNDATPFSFAQGTIHASHMRYDTAVGLHNRTGRSTLLTIPSEVCIPLSLCESTSLLDPRKLDPPKVWTPPTQLVRNDPRSQAALTPATSTNSEHIVEGFSPFLQSVYCA